MRKSQIPCQVVYNRLFVDNISKEISCLNQLELFLIYKWFSFKKNINDANRASTKSVTKYREYYYGETEKKSFKGHVFFEPVRREKICVALTYWKYNNPLYSDIQIDEDNIMKLLVTDCTEEIPIALAGVHEGNGPKVNDTTIKDEEEIANPLQNYQHQAIESLVVDNNTYEIAPGEGLLAKKNSLWSKLWRSSISKVF